MKKFESTYNNPKLRRKKILILSPLFGVSKVFYSQLLEAITNLGKKFNFQILIQPVNINDKKTLEYYYSPLFELDGIIAITCQVENTDWISKTKEYGIPLVLIHDNIDFSKLKYSTVVSFIQPDLTGLNNLINHLVIDHSVTEVSVVMVNPKDHTLRQKKLNIIKEALKKNNLNFNQEKQLYLIKEYSQKEGKKIVKEILKNNPKTEAIVCLADTTAIGIINELKERDINNILVTGFDNIELAEEFNLTTVDQQLRVIGETALADLNNAIRNKSFSTDHITYIPTTLIKRLSCCKPLNIEYIKENPLPRFAVYYNIEDRKVLKVVDQMRLKIYRIENPKLDRMTIKFLGKAPLYPLHITLKGIFQLRLKEYLTIFIKEIKHLAKTLERFKIIAENLMNYPPPNFIAFGFNKESSDKLKDLQDKILKIVNKYRNNLIIEPEFRKYLFSQNIKERDYTLKYGEPFVYDLFIPHVSIASGIENKAQYEIIKKAIEKDFNSLKPLSFIVNKISILYETTLGGKWEVLEEYHLK